MGRKLRSEEWEAGQVTIKRSWIKDSSNGKKKMVMLTEAMIFPGVSIGKCQKREMPGQEVHLVYMRLSRGFLLNP